MTKSSTLYKDKKRYKRFLYMKAKSFSYRLNLLIKLIVKEVYLFYIFLTIISRFNRVYTSNVNDKRLNIP
jgi:hypothetical protein